jgi:hypothetical protein
MRKENTTRRENLSFIITEQLSKKTQRQKTKQRKK